MKNFQNELYHYGVKDMHWGVRHGPPYPLARGGRALTSLLVKSRDPEKMAAKAKAKEERKAARAERRTQRAIARAEKKERKQAERAANEAKRAEEEAKNKEAEETRAREATVKRIREEVRKNPRAIKNLSDNDLDLLITRLNSEQKVIDNLNKQNQFVDNVKERNKSLGRKMVETQMADIGKNAIVPLITGTVTASLYDSRRRKLSEKYVQQAPDFNKMSDEDREETIKEVQDRVDKHLGMYFARVNKQKK